jgi:hypothetical protein
MLLNKTNTRAALLSEAKRQGKRRLDRVSADAYLWLERELQSRLEWLVSVHPHGGPKTIASPDRGTI